MGQSPALPASDICQPLEAIVKHRIKLSILIFADQLYNTIFRVAIVSGRGELSVLFIVFLHKIDNEFIGSSILVIFLFITGLANVQFNYSDV